MYYVLQDPLDHTVTRETQAYRDPEVCYVYNNIKLGQVTITQDTNFVTYVMAYLIY